MAVTLTDILANVTTSTENGRTQELQFYATDDASPTNEANIITAVNAAVPATRTVDGTTVTLRGISRLRYIGAGRWNVSVRYTASTPTERPETGDSAFSFSIRGGGRTIRQSISTQAYAPPSATVPDFGGAINVSDAGPQGVQFPGPGAAYNETHYLSGGTVTAAWFAGFVDLLESVNDATFRGLAAGTMLFVGVDGSRRSVEDDWEVTFSWLYAPNKTGQTIAGITGVAYDGHEIVDVYYEEEEDTSAKRIIKKPRAVYVHTVAPSADFSVFPT